MYLSLLGVARFRRSSGNLPDESLGNLPDDRLMREALSSDKHI